MNAYFINVILFIIFLTSAALGEIPKGEFPSGSYSVGNSYSNAARFVISPRSDMRLNHSKGDILDDRIARSVCIFDNAGILSDENGLIDSREVKVDKGMNVEDVLRKAGAIAQWKKALPQVRIIKQNSIHQSPTSPGTTREELNAFLLTPVAAGDIIVICWVR